MSYGGLPYPLRVLRAKQIAFVLAASQYVPVLGTAWVAGAATGLAADGVNLVTNGESWTGGPPPTGWAELDGTGVAVDSAVDPGAPSGGLDSTVAKLTAAGAACRLTTASTLGFIAGATYASSCRAYAPSGNTRVNAARLACAQWLGMAENVTAEDAWQTIGTVAVAVAGTAPAFYIAPRDAANLSTAGDLAYFDTISCQQQRSIATAEAGPNHRLTQVVTMPGAGVVPFGNRSRYQDASNSWYWRITPGTAGTDFELVEVNAGVSTTRASADIDWAASTAYTLTLTARGNVYTALVDGVAKLSYTDASNFLISEPTIAISDGKVGNAVLGSTLVEVL